MREKVMAAIMNQARKREMMRKWIVDENGRIFDSTTL